MPRPKKVETMPEPQPEESPEPTRIRSARGDWVEVPAALMDALCEYRRTHDHYEALHVVQTALYHIEITGVPA